MQGLNLTADLHHCESDPRWLTGAALTALFERVHVERHQLAREEITA